MNGVGVLGVIGLVVVLALVAVVAVLRWRYDGRLREHGEPERDPAGSGPSLADLGVALPAGQVTVVQFTGEFCAVCPQAKTLVQRVLRDSPDIAHVELDVAEHPDAVRALDVRRTPTLIIVDASGQPVHRASGMPREHELRRAFADLAPRG